ncbi:MAG: WD40/YVTN/BNR-like repeat-containing protein [Fimbriimonas sp.]
MENRAISSHFFALALLATTAVAWSQSPAKDVVDPGIYAGLKWRSIGPYRGGRSIAVAGSVQRPKEFYFGATGGGVWKSTDSGVNWKPVSDGFFTTASVGAIAVAPSNPDVVIAGTGERDIRGNISHGDGVYRSDDGGKTWRNIGLGETQTISHITIHPTDPNTIWVAALGHVYGAHPARGVYKTTDGGITWRKVLAGTERSGAVDLAIDASNPKVLLAAMWEGWRTAYTMNSGGKDSKFYKSTDGGETWTDLSSRPGLPKGLLGKIGVAISPVDPNRYWALIESLDGGLFRSDDAGATWQMVNDSRNWRQRAWYYTHVIADTKNKDAVYVLNVGAGKSTDGGKTFSGLGTPHSDNHDLWIAPDDPNRIINANDGGANVSLDGGKTWTEQDIPTGQFYHVVTDNAFPYRILGAQQDNSTVRIPSRTEGFGITAKDWTSTAGGESGYLAPKPNDPDVVFGGSYGGDLSWYNHRTGQSRAVDPWPDNPMGHGAIDLVHRFQWTYPIVFSIHDPNVLYTCSQYVLKSTNGGQTWRKISPDLTRNDPSTLGPSGGPITKDNTSVEYYGTVFAIAESPRRKGLIWAGSDDGLIHISLDSGKSWKDVTPSGMPKWGLVSMIEASPFEAGTAYAAIDNHENDDYTPIIYRTRDFGKSWTKITSGLPETSFVRVVREDKRRKGLLYAGTEAGVWVSFNGGERWQTLQQNLPVTPIHDLVWKDDDLVVATHGRGFWVLDDVSPLQALAADASAKARLFPPREALAVRWGGSGEGAGANPPSGLILNYYLPADAKDLKFEILDGENKVIQTVGSAPKGKGFQRTSTFLQMPSFKRVPGMILWAGFSSPIIPPPGQYSVAMTVDGVRTVTPFRWSKDPRTTATDKDLVEKYRFQRQIVARLDEANDAVLRIRTLRTSLEKSLEEVRNKNASTKSVTDLIARLTKVEEAIYQTKNKSGQDPLNYPIRLNDKLAGVYSNVSNGDYRPTDQAYEVFNLLSKALGVELKTLEGLLTKDLVELNKTLGALGIAPAEVGKLPVLATAEDEDDEISEREQERRERGKRGGG